jgi:hypothetical protein
MRLIYAGIILTCASLGFADTITLKNGSVVNGTFLGGTARTVRVDDGNTVQTLDVSDIVRIEFGQTTSSVNRERERDERPTLRRESNVMRPNNDGPPPPPPAMAMTGVELPAGTNLTIRMIDAVDSEMNRVGQTFRGSLDQPVMLNGDTVIPRGADVTVKLVDAKQSGKLAGKTDLTLSLQSISINGRMVDINTQSVSEESSSRGAKTAKVAGGTAALGAIIGGIAGGGKGAAIGAGAGAAAGAGAQVMTAGQRVRIPSETRLTFVLDNSVRL